MLDEWTMKRQETVGRISIATLLKIISIFFFLLFLVIFPLSDAFSSFNLPYCDLSQNLYLHYHQHFNPQKNIILPV